MSNGQTPPTAGQTLAPNTGGGGSPTNPGAPVGSVQYNNSGAFGGSSKLTWDPTTDYLQFLASDPYFFMGSNASGNHNPGIDLGNNAGKVVSMVQQGTLAGTIWGVPWTDLSRFSGTGPNFLIGCRATNGKTIIGAGSNDANPAGVILDSNGNIYRLPWLGDGVVVQRNAQLAVDDELSLQAKMAALAGITGRYCYQFEEFFSLANFTAAGGAAVPGATDNTGGVVNLANGGSIKGPSSWAGAGDGAKWCYYRRFSMPSVSLPIGASSSIGMGFSDGVHNSIQFGIFGSNYGTGAASKWVLNIYGTPADTQKYINSGVAADGNAHDVFVYQDGTNLRVMLDGTVIIDVTASTYNITDGAMYFFDGTAGAASPLLVDKAAVICPMTSLV